MPYELRSNVKYSYLGRATSVTMLRKAVLSFKRHFQFSGRYGLKSGAGIATVYGLDDRGVEVQVLVR
jgi:hypothetical protein